MSPRVSEPLITPGAAAASERIDLVSVIEGAMGDPTALRNLLRTKLTASRFDYKGRIQELADFAEDLKTALAQQTVCMKEALDAVAPLQESVNARLSVAAAELAAQRASAQHLAAEAAAAKQKGEVHEKQVEGLRQEMLLARQERQQALMECAQKIENVEARCKADVAEIADSHQRQLDEVARTHRRQLDESVSQRDKQAAEWTALLEQATAREAELRSQLANALGESDQVREGHSRLIQENATLNGAAAELRAAKQDLQAQLEVREAALSRREEEWRKLQADLAETEMQLRRRTDDVEAMAIRMKEQQEEFESHRAEGDAAHKQLLEAQRQLSESEGELGRARSRLVEGEGLVSKRSEEVRQLRMQLAAEVSAVSRKDSDLESLRAQVVEKDDMLIHQDNLLLQRTSEIQALRTQLIEKEARLQAAQAQLHDRDSFARELDADRKTLIVQLREREEELKNRHVQVQVLEARVHAQDAQLQHRSDDWRETMQSLTRMHGDNNEQVQFERQRTKRLEEEVQQLRVREQELREEARSFMQQADQLRLELERHRRSCTEVQAALQKSEGEREQLADIAAKSQDAAKLQEARISELGRRASELETEVASLSAALEEKTREAECLVQAKNLLQLEFTSYKEHHGVGNHEQMGAITDLKLTVDRLSKQVDAKQVQLQEQAGTVGIQREYSEHLESRLAIAERTRRELHNIIQELKGNIRVFCRVRPATEGADQAVESIEVDKMSVNYGGESYSFAFDRIFGPTAAQSEVFDEVSSLVQSALDGYRVCIFAYGQTGSGKTFTMQGTQNDQEHLGLIPRSLTQIFEESRAMTEQGWAWSLRASFFEVYNEQFRDLLQVDCGSANCSPRVHVIKHDEAWGTTVTNMSSVEVDSMKQIQELTARAAKRRAVGATDMNAVSSRSHSVFALYLKGINQKLNAELKGALHLVDLAGSERLDKSGSSGDRLKEAQNINKSLASLTDVFLAKTEKRSHVPFRNSKLTHLMEPCLSGQGKTMMLVNVCPESVHAHETLSSLRFASQVTQCNTGGKAKRSFKSMYEAACSPPRSPKPQVVTRMQSARVSRSPPMCTFGV